MEDSKNSDLIYETGISHKKKGKTDNMKKRIAAGAICLAMSLTMAACGSTNATGEAETESEQALSEDEEIYAYEYDNLSELVTLGQYKGLEYTIIDTTISDEDVEAQVEDAASSMGEYAQVTDRAVEEGDTVYIDFTGKIDGEEFDGGSSTDYPLEIGSDSFIDGFEDGLVGVMPGETVDLNLTFPEDYGSEDLAGKDVVFTVTVNYIQGDYVIPEITDDLIAEFGIDGVSTVDEYRAYVREYMEEEAESNAQSTIENELFEKTMANSVINEYPQELVDQYADSYKLNYEEYASYYGMELDDFLSTYVGLTEEEFEEEAQEYGKESAGYMLVICAIAEAEGFEVTDEIYDSKLAEYVDLYGFTDAEEIESSYGEKYLKQVIINEEVLNVIKDNAIGVEPEEEIIEESETETSAAQ